MAKQLDDHYTDMGIEPIIYSTSNKLDPYQHTVIKYVTRWRAKGGLRDLKAAHLLLGKYIKEKEKEGQEDFSEEKALKNVINLIFEKGQGTQYKTIVTSGRGGMWAAANLAYALNIEDVRVIPLKEITQMTGDDVLFVDDIVDTGDTITGMMIDSASLYIRHSTRIRPTYGGIWINDDNYVNLPISQKFDTKGDDVEE